MPSTDEKLRIIERFKEELEDIKDREHHAYVSGFIAGLWCDIDD